MRKYISQCHTANLSVLTLVISVALESVSKEPILLWTLTDIVVLGGHGQHQTPGHQNSVLVFDDHVGSVVV